MKKIAFVVVLLGCIQFQSSYAVGSIFTLRDLLNSGSKPTKEWLEALARSATTGGNAKGWLEGLAQRSATGGNISRLLVRAGTQKVAAETAKVTIKEAGEEVAKKTASGFWGYVGGLAGSIGVDIAWRAGSTAYGLWQGKKLDKAKDNFYSALEKNKDNELNILTGFPKGCEEEIAVLLKLSGG
jgi:hypothetical protein